MHDHALCPLVTLLATLALPTTVLAADLEVTKVTETPGEGHSGTVCLITSQDLEESPDLITLKAYMSAQDLGSKQEIAISPFVRGQQLCATGFKAGGRYELTVKKGLRAANGDALASDVTKTVLMSDLGSYLGLEHGTLLPNTLSEGSLYLKAVNLKGVRTALYRIQKEDLLASDFASKIFSDLDQWTFRNLIFNHASKLGESMLTPDDSGNETSYIELKLSDLAGQKLEDGVYVLAAADASNHKDAMPNDDDYSQQGRWFSRVLVVSDLGVTAFRGERALFVGVHSLKSANPVAGAKVSLISRGNTVLGSVQSDSSGIASFTADTLKGDFGDTPAAVSVSMGADFFMLPLASSSALDISALSGDQAYSAVGSTAEYPDLRTMVYTDRGIFRPGEKVHVTALIRNRDLKAADLNAVTLNVMRPDRISMSRLTLSPKGAGFFEGEYELPDAAVRGNWSAEITLGDICLGQTGFSVQDFIPQTLEATVSDAALDAGQAAELALSAAYNYGSPASYLEVVSGISVSALEHPFATTDLKDYRFGPAQDEAAKIIDRRDFDMQKLDADGKAAFPVTPAESPYAMRLSFAGNVFDGPSAVPFSREYSVYPKTPLIGIKHDPKQDILNFVSVDKNGQNLTQDLRVTLLRIVRDYQYVYEDHAWRFIRHEAKLPLSSQVVTTAAQEGLSLAELADGEYLVKVKGLTGGESSMSLRKGYAISEDAAMTPDTMSLTLDKESYVHGQKVAVTLTAPQSGFVDLGLGSERIVSMKRYEVHQGENTLSFKLPADFKEGLHLLAAFTAPVNEAPVPFRAFGLAYLKCADTAAALELKLTAPKVAVPGGTLEATLECPAKDDEIFYEAALVDTGILSLTGFEVPDPYALFTAPERYGIEIHDLTGLMLRAFKKPDQGYGALDEMLGAGAAPSSIASFNQRIVALHHGVTKLEDGKADLSFQIPQFTGSLKLMVTAASAASLGHAASEIKVHDQAAASLALPAVARSGDKFKTSFKLQNIAADADSFELKLSCEGAVSCKSAAATLKASQLATAFQELEFTADEVGEGRVRYDIKGKDFSRSDTVTLDVLQGSPEILVMNSQSVKKGEKAALELSPRLLPGASIVASVGGLPYGDHDAYRDRLLNYPCRMGAGETALSVMALLRQRESEAQNAAIQNFLDNLQAVFNAQGYADGVDAYESALSFEALKRGYDAGFAVSLELLERLRNMLQGYARSSDDVCSAAPALKALAQAGHGNLAQLRYLFDRQDTFSPLIACAFAEAFALHGDYERSQKALLMLTAGLSQRQALVTALNEAQDDKSRAQALEDLRNFERVSMSSAAYDTAAAAITAYDLKHEELLSKLDFSSLKDPAALDAGTLALFYELSSHYPPAKTAEATADAQGKIAVENTSGQDAFVTVRALGYPESTASLAGNMQVKRSFFKEDGTPFKSLKDFKVHENAVMLVEVKRAVTGGSAWVSLALPTGFGYLKTLSSEEGSPFGETLYPATVQNGDTGLMLTFNYLPYDSSTLRFAVVVRPDLEGNFSLPALQVRELESSGSCIYREQDTQLTVSK